MAVMLTVNRKVILLIPTSDKAMTNIAIYLEVDKDLYSGVCCEISVDLIQVMENNKIQVTFDCGFLTVVGSIPAFLSLFCCCVIGHYTNLHFT